MPSTARQFFINAVRRVSSKETRDLVVLIHGFGAQKVTMLPLAAAVAPVEGGGSFRAVLNHGYRTRKMLLHEHSDLLIDVIGKRLRKEAFRNVHFVTHSFGGVVLRSAFGRGLSEILPSKESRTALIAPPLRGAILGRNFETLELGGSVLPDSARKALRACARAYVGDQAGMQLLTKPPEWFEKVGTFPEFVDVLVIEGKLPVVSNPLIGSESSDGVVAQSETMLSTKHRRVSVVVPHNLLMVSPSTLGLVKKHIDGGEVGEWHPGSALDDRASE